MPAEGRAERPRPLPRRCREQRGGERRIAEQTLRVNAVQPRESVATIESIAGRSRAALPQQDERGGCPTARLGFTLRIGREINLRERHSRGCDVARLVRSEEFLELTV